MKAKPFIKWVGGKSRHKEQLEAKLPAYFDSWDNATFIMPIADGRTMSIYRSRQK